MNEGLEGSKKEIRGVSRLLDLSKVIRYLRDPEKKEGGFSFAPELYPDIEDTYYAVQILQFLDVDVDRNNTGNYMKIINWKEVGFPRAIYMLVYLHLSLGAELPRQMIDLSGKDWSGFGKLDAQYFSDEIQKLLKRPSHSLQPLSYFQFHLKDNLQTLRKKVSILLNHGIDFNYNDVCLHPGARVLHELLLKPPMEQPHVPGLPLPIQLPLRPWGFHANPRFHLHELT